jgi:hypothetical protein
MCRLAIALICLSASSLCRADWAVTGIRLECLQSLGQFRFSAETVSPAELEATAPKEAASRFLAQARKEGLFVQGKHDYRCVINDVVFVGRVAIAPPSERGECGGNPGGTISVTANGKEVLNVPFGNHCFASAWSGRISVPGRHDAPNTSAGLTVCGYGRFQSNGEQKPKCSSGPMVSPAERPFGVLELEKLVGGG